MWIIVGYAICEIAAVLGCWKLYTAARHSFRSDSPRLFVQYWKST